MPENFGDFCKRRASSDHLSGQTVTEQVSRTSTRALHSGSRKRLPNDVAYSRRTSQSDMRWIHSLEHSPRFAYATILTNV